MHSTLYYKDVFDRRYIQLMPKIEKLARLRDGLQAKGHGKKAAEIQGRIADYTIEMGDTPRYIDRFTDGTQLISLFGLEWGEIADEYTDNRGRMTPAYAMKFLAYLTAREEFFRTRTRAVAGWWIIPNPMKERRLRRKYADLKTYLQTVIKRKEALGITP
ncbi:hypothetical protein ACFLYO_01605 [Chloroflexota bacterium]